MKIVRCKVSNSFLSKIFRNEVGLAESELPHDVEVVKIAPEDEWFWVYLRSREFVDIDLDYEVVPEVPIWFGPGRRG